MKIFTTLVLSLLIALGSVTTAQADIVAVTNGAFGGSAPSATGDSIDLGWRQFRYAGRDDLVRAGFWLHDRDLWRGSHGLGNG
jgi:hypothetical protein